MGEYKFSGWAERRDPRSRIVVGRLADIWIEKVLYVKRASVRLNIDSEHDCE